MKHGRRENSSVPTRTEADQKFQALESWDQYLSSEQIDRHITARPRARAARDIKSIQSYKLINKIKEVIIIPVCMLIC